MSETADVLQQAQEDAKLLHEAADRLNQKLAELEKIMVAQRFGVVARVELKIDAGGTGHFLVWGKDGNAWHLLYQHGDEHMMPLTNAPRALRMMAIKHMSRLFVAIREAIIEETSQVNQRIGDVDRLVLAVEKATTP